MLKELAAKCRRIDIGKDAERQRRRDIFEAELAYGLLKVREVKEKAQEYLEDYDEVLEGRMELYFQYVALLNRKPITLEKSSVPNYLKTVRTSIDRIQDLETRRKLENFLHALETELYVLVCMRYYFFDDEGHENPDADNSCERFRDAAERLLAPLVQSNKKRPEKSEDDLVLCRSYRIGEILDIFEGGMFFDDRFIRIAEQFDEQEIVTHALHLIVEIQLALYGHPRDHSFSIPDAEEDMEIKAHTEAVLLKQVGEQPRKKAVLSPDEDWPDVSRGTKTIAKPLPPARFVDEKQPATVRSANQETSSRVSTGTQEELPFSSKPSASRSGNGAGFSSPLGRKGGRVFFTAEEDEALREGVRKYGSQWARMLSDSELGPIFRSVKERSSINLKDRWRTLSKA